MANQYKPDPRQALFLKYYLDPKSETFSNAYQSAMEAGYTEEYASQILSKDLEWLSENVRYENIIKKAEKNLDEFMSDEDRRIRADMTKFALERLKKDKYSPRSEVKGQVDIKGFMQGFIDEKNKQGNEEISSEND